MKTIIAILAAGIAVGCGSSGAPTPFVPVEYKPVEKVTIVPGGGLPDINVYRFEVPGGWLYVCNRSGAVTSTFVASHESLPGGSKP